jgi:hypothetical protein
MGAINIPTFVHVFGESVDDSSGRSHVKEGHRRVEDSLQHGIVELWRSGQKPDGQRDGFNNTQDQENDETDTVNQLKRK